MLQQVATMTRVGWKWPMALAVAGGLLLWASFFVPGLAFVALVPLGLLARLEAARRPLYLAAWIGGLAWFLPGIAWIRFCDESAWMGWLLLSAFLALYVPLFVLLTRVWHRRFRMPLVLVIPVAWVAAEYLRMHFLSGFGWLLLAHSIYRWPIWLQSADTLGVYGVSFVVALVNGLLVELLTRPLVLAGPGNRRRLHPILIRHGLAVAATILAALGYGGFRLHEASFTPGPRLALVQTNLPQNLKNDDAETSLRHVLAVMRKMKGKNVDLVIWPETSYPYYYGDLTDTMSDSELDRLRLRRRSGSTKDETPSADMGRSMREAASTAKVELADIVDRLGKPLLVGLIRHDFRSGTAGYFNSAVLFRPGVGAVGAYDKRHPVPFGEYLPLEGWLPFLRALMPYDAGTDFGIDAATQVQPLRAPGLNFACLICFEDTIPDLTREAIRSAEAQAPIDFLVNQSNDGWFRGSVESEYHLAAAVFRSIEGRIPMARVSNMGITSLVDGNGRVVQALEDANGRRTAFADVLEVTVPLDPRTAPYVRLGDIFALCCLVLAGAGLVLDALRHVVRFRRRPSPCTAAR